MLSKFLIELKNPDKLDSGLVLLLFDEKQMPRVESAGRYWKLGKFFSLNSLNYAQVTFLARENKHSTTFWHETTGDMPLITSFSRFPPLFRRHCQNEMLRLLLAAEKEEKDPNLEDFNWKLDFTLIRKICKESKLSSWYTAPNNRHQLINVYIATNSIRTPILYYFTCLII